MSTTGYLHPLYASSLTHLGEPRQLPASRGWILERPIAGSGLRDATGGYPIFSCERWEGLRDDLEALRDDLVSVCMVTDPFGDFDPAALSGCFTDVFFRYKEHHVADLARSPRDFVAGHHQRNARRALTQVEVRCGEDPGALREDWIRLYGVLRERHGIQGAADFAPDSLAAQLRVPGTVVLRALAEGETVGMVLWYVQRGVAYYHLGAYDDRGYDLRASFAVFWTALQYFADAGCRWISLGAGAGVRSDGTDGLNRFKAGWATDTRPVYFGGRVLAPDAYRRLAGGAGRGDFFPAYRG